jgi:hypothetical protein
MNAKKLINRVPLLALFYLLGASFASAQGTLPIMLTQNFSFIGCSTTGQACGTPLTGGLLYFYQVGTVATPQNSYQDTGLTILNPWPLQLDANGRVPAFYLANGSIHVRLTDASGVVQFDYPSMLVIGPSAGGGGGSGIDPTSIASTGDIKFRASGETLNGWIRLNGLTIGSAVSGATGRANADTQLLFTYLWTNCPQSHCQVSGGVRLGTAALDFAANKTISVMDWRGRTAWGLDDMGAAAAGRILPSNVTSGGGDTVTTPNATGGEANHTLVVGELASHRHFAGISDPSHTHSYTSPFGSATAFGGSTPVVTQTTTAVTGAALTGVRVDDGVGNLDVTGLMGSNTAHNTMAPFILGSWYIKL